MVPNQMQNQNQYNNNMGQQKPNLGNQQYGNQNQMNMG